MESLYIVSQRYRSIVDQIVQAGGEANNIIIDLLAENRNDLTTAASNFALLTRELEGQVKAYEAEIARLTKLKQQAENSIESIKKQVAYAMDITGTTSIKGELINISFRKSEETVIENEALIPDIYKDSKTVKTVDKKAIKEIIKAGIEVPGASVVEKKNIQFK